MEKFDFIMWASFEIAENGEFDFAPGFDEISPEDPSKMFICGVVFSRGWIKGLFPQNAAELKWKKSSYKWLLSFNKTSFI